MATGGSGQTLQMQQGNTGAIVLKQTVIHHLASIILCSKLLRLAMRHTKKADSTGGQHISHRAHKSKLGTCKAHNAHSRSSYTLYQPQAICPFLTPLLRTSRASTNWPCASRSCPTFSLVTAASNLQVTSCDLSESRSLKCWL